jgi:hypothetical protein
VNLTILLKNGTKREISKVYQVGEAFRQLYICCYRDPLMLKEGYVNIIHIPLDEIVDVLADFDLKGREENET